MKASLRHLVLPLFVAFACACEAERPPAAAGAPAPSAPAPELPASTVESTVEPRGLGPLLTPPAPQAFVTPYPRASWRFVKVEDLEQVVLWFSQVLIRHQDARNEVAFNLGYWSSVLPPATRTRDEALVLAQQVADEATRDPRHFPELARQYSEDLTSRDEGGAVGGYKASLLMLWPQVLDALAAVKPGQTSQVVETKYGFHVFYRSAPPPEEAVSGEHILIGHEQAPWLEVFARNQAPKRSREEALALASELYRKAASEPERFGELVERYSEHYDAVAGGDFGVWSTREAFSYPLRMKRLSELSPGSVGAPIETHLGYEIIRRTPLRQRKRYRARMLAFSVDDVDESVPGHDNSRRASAQAQARAAAKTLVGTPSSFDEQAGAHMLMQWEEGRELPALGRALDGLSIGQITPEPVFSEYGFLVAQRLEPEPVPAVLHSTDLPSPEHPDLEHFLGQISAADTEIFLRTFSEDASQRLALSAETTAQLRALHELGGRLNDDTPRNARMALLTGILIEAQRLLGAERYERYRSALNQVVAELLLGAPAESERGF